MTCELMGCCQFFEDNMKELPKAAEFIKNKLCLGDYQSCNRYKIYKEYGRGPVPSYLFSGDTEQVKKVLECLTKDESGRP